MSNIPSDIKTEEEARRWLMRSGYGLGMIDAEIAAWTPPAAPAPAPKKAEVKATPAPAPKKVVEAPKTVSTPKVVSSVKSDK